MTLQRNKGRGILTSVREPVSTNQRAAQSVTAGGPQGPRSVSSDWANTSRLLDRCASITVWHGYPWLRVTRDFALLRATGQNGGIVETWRTNHRVIRFATAGGPQGPRVAPSECATLSTFCDPLSTDHLSRHGQQVCRMSADQTNRPRLDPERDVIT